MWAMLWYCDIVTRDKNGRTFQKKLIRVSIKVCEVSQLLGDLIKYWTSIPPHNAQYNNWLLFIRFSCHQFWRCLHPLLWPPKMCPAWSGAAADKWQAMHQKISSGKKRPPLRGKNCLTLMLLMHRTSSFCNLDLDVPSRLPKLLYCVECLGPGLISGGDWREELSSLINGASAGLISGQWPQFHASS